MRDENCIFCKLANGDIPTTTLYEDDTFRVIFDASPATVGHVLIIPKEHYEDLTQLPDEVAAQVMPLARRGSRALPTATASLRTWVSLPVRRCIISTRT